MGVRVRSYLHLSAEKLLQLSIVKYFETRIASPISSFRRRCSVHMVIPIYAMFALFIIGLNLKKNYRSIVAISLCDPEVVTFVGHSGKAEKAQKRL